MSAHTQTNIPCCVDNGINTIYVLVHKTILKNKTRPSNAAHFSYSRRDIVLTGSDAAGLVWTSWVKSLNRGVIDRYNAKKKGE